MLADNASGPYTQIGVEHDQRVFVDREKPDLGRRVFDRRVPDLDLLTIDDLVGCGCSGEVRDTKRSTDATSHAGTRAAPPSAGTRLAAAAPTAHDGTEGHGPG